MTTNIARQCIVYDTNRVMNAEKELESITTTHVAGGLNRESIIITSALLYEHGHDNVSGEMLMWC